MAFFDAAYAAGARPLRLYEADPDLLGDGGAGHPLARVPLDLLRVPAGHWTPAADGGPPALGYLVVEGVLARHVVVRGQRRAELLGAGDLLRPGAREQLESVPFEELWDVLQPARLAVLDDAFIGAAAAAPDVLATLAARTVDRSHRLIVQMAFADLRHIEDRLVALFWHLGQRWGRVSPHGIQVPIRMTHELISELVGAKRPTVTTGLGELERRHLLQRLPDRTWRIARTLETLPSGLGVGPALTDVGHG